MTPPALVLETRNVARVVQLTVPGWAPSKSNSYRIGNGRLFKGSPGRAGNACRDFEEAALAAMVTSRVEPFECAVTVEAMVYPPNMRSDIPGCEKVLLDSLQNWRRKAMRGKSTKVVNIGGYGCYLNDAQVRRFVVDFGGVDKTNPRIVVRVSPWMAR